MMSFGGKRVIRVDLKGISYDVPLLHLEWGGGRGGWRLPDIELMEKPRFRMFQLKEICGKYLVFLDLVSAILPFRLDRGPNIS
jgi:hypothetical protein